MLSQVVAKLDCFSASALEVHLLPRTSWDETFALQQRLVYEVSEPPRRRAALILCEHPPIITVGRQGSRSHIRFEQEELASNQLDLRWTNRGGGCWLQIPGQLAVYPVLPLDPQRLGLERYRAALYQTLIDVLEEFGIRGERDTSSAGVTVGDREIASVGIAVKQWVAYHGCLLNVGAAPEWFEQIQCNPLARERRMTSMFRERRLPIRTTTVREAFVRHFVRRLGFRDYHLLQAPSIHPQPRRANVATGTR